jgi:sulfatase maturation enzyme AslB (radical SAM superfamily)
MAKRTPDDMNINTHSIEDFITSDFRKSVQQDLTNGTRHKTCSKCWHDESLGKRSYRQSCNSKYKVNTTNWEKFYKFINPDNKFIDIEIQHTNICNLKCYMCFNKNSHSLQNENLRLGLIKHKTEYNFPLDSIDDLISDSKYITIRGGEPLINIPLMDKVEQWLNRGWLDNTKLIVVSNCTDISRWLPTLERIPNLQIMASIDGYGDVYNYLRFPGNWDVTSSNILQLNKFCKVIIHSVVQNVNVFTIDQLIEWSESNEIPIEFYPIEDPPIYNTLNLPQGLLDASIEKLSKLEIKSSYTQTSLQNLTNYLKSNSSDMTHWEDFWHMIYKRQSVRKNNVLDVFQELSNYERPRI